MRAKVLCAGVRAELLAERLSAAVRLLCPAGLATANQQGVSPRVPQLVAEGHSATDEPQTQCYHGVPFFDHDAKGQYSRAQQRMRLRANLEAGHRTRAILWH